MRISLNGAEVRIFHVKFQGLNTDFSLFSVKLVWMHGQTCYVLLGDTNGKNIRW